MDFNEKDYLNQTGEEQTPLAENTEGSAAANEEEAPQAEQPYVTHPAQEEAAQPQMEQPYVTHHAPEEPRQEPKKSHKGLRATVAAILALALVAGSCGLTAGLVNHKWEGKTAQMEQTMNQKIEDLQKRVNAPTAPGAVPGHTVVDGEYMTPSQVYAQNVNSVVGISNQGERMSSSGSGFIISENGYVVSNYHVVEGAVTLSVITHDGTEYPAELVGYVAANDVSLLKIEAEGLTPVKLGSSDELVVGDQVAAIGNPLGELTATLTVGYISSKDRTVVTGASNQYINMMQTDAAINSGNSGGPLFNMKGEVVGITTAKYSGSSNSGASIEGIGFAIPIDDVTDIVEDLQKYGYVTGASLGVMITNMDKSVAEMYSLPIGSYVKEVVPGSAAEKAGVQPKDIIIGLGSYEVESNTDLTRALRKFEPGDTTTITVFRGGQKLDLQITLDEKAAPEEEPVPERPQPDSGEMPESGDFDEWYDFFYPFFGGR